MGEKEKSQNLRGKRRGSLVGIQRDIKFDDQTEIGAPPPYWVESSSELASILNDATVQWQGRLDARRSLIGAIEFQAGSRLVSNDRTCPLARDTSATKPRRSGTRIRRDVSIERER